MNIKLSNTKVFNMLDFVDYMSCLSQTQVILSSGEYPFIIELFEVMDTEWQMCLDEKLDHSEAYPTVLFEAVSAIIVGTEYDIKSKAKTLVRKQFKPKKIRNNGKDAMMFEGLSIIACYIDISTTSRDNVSHEYTNFLREKMEAFANHHLQTDWDNEDFEDTVLQYWNLVCEPEFNRMFKKEIKK